MTRLYQTRVQKTGDIQVTKLQRANNLAVKQLQDALGYTQIEIASAEDKATTATPTWDSVIDSFTTTSPVISANYKLNLASAVEPGDVLEVYGRMCFSNGSGIMTLQVQVTDGASQIILPSCYVNWGAAGFNMFPFAATYTFGSSMAAQKCLIGIYGIRNSGASTAQLLTNTSLICKLHRKAAS